MKKLKYIQLLSLVIMLLIPNYMQASWKLIDQKKFSLLASLFRSQGIVSNERDEVFFSANYSIIKVDSKRQDHSLEMSLLFKNKELRKYKSNHIGDIDLIDDKIIAPIEDGNKYLNPIIGIFDGNKLDFLGYIKLDHELLMDGVPWVCTDKDKNLIITSKYNNVDSFYVYDYSTINYKEHNINLIAKIKLPQIINKIQGVKYLNGSFYISSNERINNSFNIYKFDTRTNELNSIIKVPNDVTEIEGLDVKSNEDGSISLKVLTIINSGLKRRAKLYTYQQEL